MDEYEDALYSEPLAGDQNQPIGNEIPPIDATQQANEQLNPTNAFSGAVDAAGDVLGTIHRGISGTERQSFDQWKGMPQGPERDQLREEHFQRYYGKSYEDYRNSNILENLGSNLKHQELTATSWAGASVMGLLDLPMDVIGLLPGGADLDDKWDDVTKFSDSRLQGARNVLGIVIPTLMGGASIATKLSPLMKSSKVPWVTKALTNIGAYGALDAAIIGVSDQGEEDNAARALVDFFPDVFGANGTMPLPQSWVTLDGDSPRVRREKNIWESAGLSVVTNVLGYFLQAGKPTLKWFKPIDETADQYKQLEISSWADNQVLINIKEIDEALQTKNISKNEKSVLLAQRRQLVDQAKSSGSLEDWIRKNESSQLNQNNSRATRKLLSNPDITDIDPDVNPSLVSETNRGLQSKPPGNVARNMADTTGIKRGDLDGTGAPIIDESTRNKVARNDGTPRDAVVDVAEKARDAGEFSADVDGYKYTNAQMNESAYDIYRSIINADSLDDVKNLFLKNKQVLELGDSIFRNLKAGKGFKSIVEENELVGGALFALKDLTDRYVGRGIMQSSARVMDTLGREVADMSRGIRELTPHIDEDRVTKLILDKMEYLTAEVDLNKHIKGWQLKQFDNWKKAIDEARDPVEVLLASLTEFKEVEKGVATKAQRWIQELRRVQQENPLALKPLVQVFERTNGDVDTLHKLMVWGRDQVTPRGMLASPNPKQMNKFTQSSFAVAYNNMLSGLAAGKAVLGNTSALISKPITAFLGGTMEGLLRGGDFSNLKRHLYYFGSVAETNRRVLKDSWLMAKKAWKDPDAALAAARRDLVQQESMDWSNLEMMRDVWEDEGNWSRIAQLDMTRLMYDMSRWAPFRAGMVGLNVADAGLNTAMATWMSRVRAYDDVLSKFGEIDLDMLAKAEKVHYNKMFDKNGLLSDEAAKVSAGEAALNLPDALSDQINQIVTRYPFLKTVTAFPRTLSNDFKYALSWTGASLIPGLTKYGDVIWARTPDEISKAMLRHGIDMKTTPNAQTIFENLRTEYKGRLAFSSMLVGSLWSYAMGGNVTGNGSNDAAQRRVDRDQFGFKEKMIKFPVPGKDNDIWISYKGIPMLESTLSILGDLAYYARDLDSSIVEDALHKLSWTISATFLQDSVFTGLEPFVAAINNDYTWFSRHIANTTRMFLPMSGAAGVISKGIDSAQKDIHDNIIHYLQNRTPFLSKGLPKQVDIYTGKYVNDIDNPVLRFLNSVSVIQVSGTNEPWRVRLREIGYNGAKILKKDSSGTYEYTASEREYINRLVGEQEPWRKIEKILNNPKNQEDIGKLRALRSSGDENAYERVVLSARSLRVIDEINKVMRDAQKIAELQMLQERPDIYQTINDQKMINKYIEQGQIEQATDVANKNQQMVENLINLPK